MDEEQARELRSRLAAMAASFDCAVERAQKAESKLGELREAASSAVLAYGAHAHAQLRDLFNESKSGDTLKALDALALAMSNLDIALQASPVTPHEEKLSHCLEILRKIEKATRPDGVMADAAVNLLVRSGRWQAYEAREGSTHEEAQQ